MPPANEGFNAAAAGADLWMRARDLGANGTVLAQDDVLENLAGGGLGFTVQTGPGTVVDSDALNGRPAIHIPGGEGVSGMNLVRQSTPDEERDEVTFFFVWRLGLYVGAGEWGANSVLVALQYLDPIFGEGMEVQLEATDPDWTNEVIEKYPVTIHGTPGIFVMQRSATHLRAWLDGSKVVEIPHSLAPAAGGYFELAINGSVDPAINTDLAEVIRFSSALPENVIKQHTKALGAYYDIPTNTKHPRWAPGALGDPDNAALRTPTPEIQAYHDGTLGEL